MTKEQCPGPLMSGNWDVQTCKSCPLVQPINQNRGFIFSVRHIRNDGDVFSIRSNNNRGGTAVNENCLPPCKYPVQSDIP